MTSAEASKMVPKAISSSLLLLIIFSSFSLAASQTTPEDGEGQILLQIKEDWGNPSVLSSWNDSTAISHCKWTGIECSVDGSVTNISLVNQNITQPIPVAICKLKNLSILDLSYNDIPGTFPTFLYNCSNLLHLDLSQNYFVGVIPSDIYRLSPRLTHLILSANNFTGDIPPSISRLSALEYLTLDNNFFDASIPVELGNLSNLQTLWLAYNPFSPATIPSTFRNLTQLSFLWMSETNLKGEIPEFIGELTEMFQLDLAWNSLSGSIPAGIWNLKKLRNLYLYANNLTGAINIDGPIGALGLEEIDVSMNQLNGSIPEEFGKLQNLSILFMYYNRFSGEIPARIGLLPSLTDLRLFNNSLIGVLPPELGKYSPLWNFEVWDNMISGSLPEYLCASGSLTSIAVFNNNLTGNVPTSLNNCSTLYYINIKSNKFSGDFPTGIWSAVNLTTVIMNDNALSGALPEKLPPKLTLMQLQNNQFSGALPNELPSDLTWLEIQKNQFSGTIPDKLPSKLFSLNIENNRFSGNIPSIAKRLQVLKATNNLLSGKIPADLTGISELRELYLGGNLISGQIPPGVSELKFLCSLNLSSNHLVGEIPAAIGSLQVLNSLDLSINQLSHSIPPEIGNLKLNTLNLSSNRLSGEIPISLNYPAYNRSFLSNPSLCASNELLNVRICKHGLQWKLRIMLIVLAALVSSMAIVFAVLVRRARHGRSNGRVLPTWNMMSFYPLDFTESAILSGLTEDNLIGSGGGGKVYRIVLENHVAQIVAVKKIWNSGNLDCLLEKEFQSEVQILGSIRHANIVKLLCCLWSVDTKLLVYEYMENGSLGRWLHKKGRVGEQIEEMNSDHIPLLDWSTRLRIAVDVARGLCYMHHGCSPPIVHRDVKSSNILLDSKFRAKVADFGLARMLVKRGQANTVSAIAGTIGYMAPECAYSRKINEKMDVYSFGVILLELTTGKKANDGGEYSSLAEWAWRCLQEADKMIDAIDQDIKNLTYVEEIATVFKLGVMCTSPLPLSRLGVMCTSPLPLSRPTMKDVLHILLRHQQAVANEPMA